MHMHTSHMHHACMPADTSACMPGSHTYKRTHAHPRTLTHAHTLARTHARKHKYTHRCVSIHPCTSPIPTFAYANVNVHSTYAYLHTRSHSHSHSHAHMSCNAYISGTRTHARTHAYAVPKVCNRAQASCTSTYRFQHMHAKIMCANERVHAYRACTRANACTLWMYRCRAHALMPSHIISFIALYTHVYGHAWYVTNASHAHTHHSCIHACHILSRTHCRDVMVHAGRVRKHTYTCT
jgi:hypothetical protein